MVAEVVADLGLEVARALPRLGHEHRDDVADVAAAAQQQLDGRVELAGVGVVRGEQRPEQLLGSEPDLLGTEVAARVHPVLVAVDGVDLAVVAQMPERLRALPRRRGVRREAAVEDGERRREVVGGEVGIEARRGGR